MERSIRSRSKDDSTFLHYLRDEGALPLISEMRGTPPGGTPSAPGDLDLFLAKLKKEQTTWLWLRRVAVLLWTKNGLSPSEANEWNHLATGTK